MESKTAKFGSSDNVDLKQSLVPNVLDGKDSVAVSIYDLTFVVEFNKSMSTS